MDDYFESSYADTVQEQSLGAIAAFLKDGTSCQVLGLPGVGRSTLLSILAHNTSIRKKYFGERADAMHFVLVNFSEVRNRPLFDVMKFLFLNLTESLRERKMTEEHKVVGDIFREHLQFQDELILFQGFKEAIAYLAAQKDIRTVLLFDRFEEYVPVVTSEFFANLRALRGRGKHLFAIVSSTYSPLETQLEPSLLADFYEFVAGHLVYLPLFDEPTTAHRIATLEKITRKKVPRDILEEIIRLTGGVGRVVKLGVEAYLAEEKKPGDLETFLLSQKTVQAALREIWFSFSPSEQAALLHLVEGKECFDHDVLRHLTLMGIIIKNVVQIPLFVRLLQDEFVSAQKQNQAIVYDIHTNTIKKGEDILSDQLTASEFRLLAFLLQNQDKIIERDELISVVWQGMKSTAGITDQAVDQLIFRLRRKIETNANSPQHLLTVKGRGFRLVG